MFKVFIAIGCIFIILGVLIYFYGNIFGWVGKLPGDISIKREKFSFYFPLTTMIIFSIVINIFYKIWVKFN